MQITNITPTAHIEVYGKEVFKITDNFITVSLPFDKDVIFAHIIRKILPQTTVLFQF